VRAGETVEVHVWRCVDEPRAKVWYEWAVTAPVRTPIYIPNGRSYSIGL
jgi:protein arginine N-methyltransferase 5